LSFNKRRPADHFQGKEGKGEGEKGNKRETFRGDGKGTARKKEVRISAIASIE